MLNTLLNLLNSVVTHIPWDILLASGVISPLLVGIKKWFSVQSEKVMITLVAVLSLLTALAHYLMTTPTSDPTIIAVQGAVLAFMTQPVYFFVVKPFYLWISGELAKANAYDQELKSAIIPEEGLPLTGSSFKTVSVSGDASDFSQ